MPVPYSSSNYNKIYFGSSHIINNSITSADIALGTIDISNLSTACIASLGSGGGGLTANSVNSSHIINGSILTEDISNNAITFDKLAYNSVGNTRIINGAVTHEKLSSNCIQSHNIVDGTILGTDICNNTITRNKLSELTTNLMIYNSDTSTTVLHYTIKLTTAGTQTTYFNPMTDIGIGMMHSLRVCVPVITTQIGVQIDTDDKTVTANKVYSGAIQVGTYTDDTLFFTLDPDGYDNIQIGFAIEDSI